MAGAFWLTREDLAETNVALILERKRTQSLAEDIQRLHDELVAARSTIVRLQRRLADERRRAPHEFRRR